MNKKLLLGLVVAVLVMSIKAKKNSKEKNSKENWTKENSKEMKNKDRDRTCGYDKDKAIEGTQLRSLGKRKLADCCDACNADSSCFFFSYDKKGNECIMWAEGSRIGKGKKGCKFSFYGLCVCYDILTFLILFKQLLEQ